MKGRAVRDHADASGAVLPNELSRDYLLHHGVCPIAPPMNGTLRVAIADSALTARVGRACDDLAQVYACGIERLSMEDRAFEQVVERLTLLSAANDPSGEHDAYVDSDTRNLANQPPVIRYVNFVLKEAYDRSASDVHFEAALNGLGVRLRVDGVLTNGPDAPPGLQHAIVSRVKLLANLDIAERRRPQDGRMRVRLDARTLDMRVSTVPTYFGESVVVRVLDHGGVRPDLHALGMPDAVLAAVRVASARSHGLVLVTGPTGSGKTTTLYAALARRRLAQEKVITVEDPIEYELPSVTQVPVNRLAGVTFASVLRSILRQDPDVIMIGEMRDAETAEIAIQAATTGHLVFSTVHTNNAAGAVVRVRDLGVPGFMLAATLELVLAQRLVRVICEQCKERYEPDADERRIAERLQLSDVELVHGRGCPRCNATGYRGRAGVFELLAVTPDVKQAIGANASDAELQHIARASGMQPLAGHAAQLVRAGTTTLSEVTRAVL